MWLLIVPELVVGTDRFITGSFKIGNQSLLFLSSTEDFFNLHVNIPCIYNIGITNIYGIIQTKMILLGVKFKTLYIKLHVANIAQ